MSNSDYNYSSDDEPVSRDHKKLLQAVSNLSKVQHIKKVVRKEPAVNQNEFDLVKPRVQLPKELAPTTSSIDVVDLVKTLKGTSKHLNVGKELKNVQSSSKVLPKPLEKPEAERVQRTITYENTKKQLQRWDAVVSQFQAAETQTFPLDSETVYINTARFKKPLPLSMKSELQIEMEEIEARLRILKGEIKDSLTEEDEKIEQMLLTKEEIKKRRQELLYLKTRESQKSAKLRLKNKIKSKKYHKLLKQHKLKEQLKEFELLQKQNPEEALEKLKSLEKHRILERANLRHKNTGTWAKNNLVKAKYNRDVQKDLAEQLALSRQLTEKKDVSEDEEDVKSDEDEVIDQVNQSNPWMKVSGKKSAVESMDTTEDGYRKYWMDRNANEKELKNHQSELTDNVANEQNAEEGYKPLGLNKLARTKNRNKKRKQNTEEDERNQPATTKKAKNAEKKKEQDAKEEKENVIETSTPATTQKTKKKRNKKKAIPTPVLENGWLVEDVKEVNTEANMQTIDSLFDKAEDDVLRQLTKKQMKRKKRDLAKKMARVAKKMRPRREKNELKNLQDLSFKKASVRAEIDEQLIETAKGAEPVLPPSTTAPRLPSKESLSQDIIKHDNYADVKPKLLKTSLAEITNCGEDLDFEDEGDSFAIDRQETINDAFEDDDIVADFGKQKDAEEKKALAEQLTLSMPGWGSWAGTGISPNSNQAKKLVLKFDSKKPLTNEKEGDKSRVRINENVNKKLREHLVSDVPFPFTSVQDYEASIRAPIGRSFVPETAFRMLTKPAVITRKGHIIKPMDESELLKPVKRPRSVIEKRILYDAQVAAQ